MATFGLPYIQQSMTRLADGTVVYVPAHRAVILWDGVVRIVLILATSGSLALLGMRMLRDFDLRARCRPGGFIEIEAAP